MHLMTELGDVLVLLTAKATMSTTGATSGIKSVLAAAQEPGVRCDSTRFDLRVSAPN
jgi:hypothetical protein